MEALEKQSNSRRRTATFDSVGERARDWSSGATFTVLPPLPSILAQKTFCCQPSDEGYSRQSTRSNVHVPNLKGGRLVIVGDHMWAVLVFRG